MTRGADHGGAVLWFTGLSGAGKSTVARASASELIRQGHRAEVLDGDMVREHLSRGLGFTREDRRTNVLRIAYVAHLLARNGVHVCVAAISPFLDVRKEARAMIGDFVEVHVATPLEVCIERDAKGLYARARSGQIAEFTGVSQPYEPSATPELRIDTSQISVEQCVSMITTTLSELGYFGPAAASLSIAPKEPT
jgi:adenylylsulfate kinase